MSWEDAFNHPLVKDDKDNIDRILMRLRIDDNVRQN